MRRKRTMGKGKQEQEQTMVINKVGKFETRKIVEDFDSALIELYGINMTDAGITRFEVMASVQEAGSARKAAEAFGRRRGLALIRG